MASIRVTKAGRFEARRWAQGQRVSKTFNSKAEALHWANQSDALLENHSSQPVPPNKTADKRDKRVHMTLAQALEVYGLECVSLQKGAKKAFYRLRELQKEPFAKKLLHEVRVDDLRDLKTRELARGCSGPTVTRKLSILSAFFSYAAYEWGMALENPVRLVRKPPASPPRVRRLTKDEEERLFKTCREGGTPYLGEVVELAIETGMRRSELLALCWGDVDLTRRLITLKDSKNGHPRFVPLSQRATILLESLREAKLSTPIVLSQSALESAWKRAIQRSGLKGLRFHDLRGEALSRWANRLSGDVFKLSLISGHRTLAIASRYVRPSLSEMLAKLN